MRHGLEGQWCFPCVSGSRALGKATSGAAGARLVRPGRGVLRSRSSAAAAFALPLLLVAFSAWGAVERSVIKSEEARAALLRGRFDIAVQAFDEALKEPSLTSGRQASIYCDRGVAKWRLRQLDAALSDLSKAISLSPDYAPAYNNRGTVYMDLNRPEDARKDFDRAIALSPHFGAAYNNRGNANERLRRLEAATNDFRKAIEIMPTNAIPHNGRGKIESALGRRYAAFRYLNRAITLNAQYAAAYRNRALVLVTLGRDEEAIQDFDKAIVAVPDKADLYVARGEALARVKRGWLAAKDFDKALELAPDNLQALVGRASQTLERRRADLALEDLNRAVTADPGYAKAYFWRAQAKSALNDIEGADADLSKAIELNPSYAEAYRIRGGIRERAGKHAEAVADLRRAVECDPLSREARDAYKSASGETAESVVRPVGPVVGGWEIFHLASGDFTAVNDRYPRIAVPLDMEDEGTPELLEWTPLADSLSGIGLLRYRAGGENDTAFENVAIVDLGRNQVVSIEPYIAGAVKSKWAWSKTSVTVTDGEGLTTYYELKKVPPVAARREDGPFTFFRRSVRRPRFFDWFFDCGLPWWAAACSPVFLLARASWRCKQASSRLFGWTSLGLPSPASRREATWPASSRWRILVWLSGPRLSALDPMAAPRAWRPRPFPTIPPRSRIISRNPRRAWLGLRRRSAYSIADAFSR